MSSKHKQRQGSKDYSLPTRHQKAFLEEKDLENLQKQDIPVSYTSIQSFFNNYKEASTYLLRKKTIIEIQEQTGTPFICYLAKTCNLPAGIFVPNSIEHSDLNGFADLVNNIDSENLDIMLVSNGGSAEATERIVRLLRSKFKKIRFFVPANAFSAATLMCFSGDEIIMDSIGCLGPIDPQIGGIPALAITNAFKKIEDKIKKEGTGAIAPFMPLLQKYDLHLFEICQNAKDLAKELAFTWLNTFMLKGVETDRINEIVDFFIDEENIHKSHSRSIDYDRAKSKHLKVSLLEEYVDLKPLIRSLYNQYQFAFDRSQIIKLFEDGFGMSLGLEHRIVNLNTN